MEAILRFATLEQARNAAIAWLESRGVVFGPHRRVSLGRLGSLAGFEVGVHAAEKPYWRLRLDYDPAKGAHFNAEVGTGPGRERRAYCFPGSQGWVERLAARRHPR